MKRKKSKNRTPFQIAMRNGKKYLTTVEKFKIAELDFKTQGIIIDILIFV